MRYPPRMSSISSHYTSFLVRLWQENAVDETTAHNWRAEVEHIQTGAQRCFLTFDELSEYLHEQALGGIDHESGTTDD